MNPKFKEIKKVELQQEGIAYMSAFSGPSHISIVMASINGSLYVWTPRPAKIIQPLAPNFVEIEDNIVYVEREDEFESEASSDDEMVEVAQEDGFGRSLISDLTKKQKKLACNEIDIYSIDAMHSATTAQVLGSQKTSLSSELEQLFSAEKTSEPGKGAPCKVSLQACHVETRIDVDDSFAVLARRNLDFFRDKFDKLLHAK